MGTKLTGKRFLQGVHGEFMKRKTTVSKKFGLAPEWITDEARKCGNCKQECHAANHIGISFDSIFNHLKKDDMQSAKNVLHAHDPIPIVSSHICYEAAEHACPHTIRIRDVVHHLSKYGACTKNRIKSKSQAVAIVGGGIAGIALANQFKDKGYEVHLFEAMSKLGGSAQYLIPGYRLPKDSLDRQIKELQECVETYTNAVIGSTVFVEELAREFDIVIIATGANKPAFPGIPGESLHGVFTANDVLLGHDTGFSGTTVILGNTNAALDAAIIEARKGNNAIVVCTKHEIPVDKDLLSTAVKESVSFMTLTEPVSIIGNENSCVKGIELRQLMLGEEDFDGKRTEIPIEDSEFIMETAKVIIATGFEPNPSISMYSTLRTIGKGKIWTNEYFQTSIKNVFAAGEMVIGHASPEKIIKNTKDVVARIEEYLKGDLPNMEEPLEQIQ